MRQEIQETTVPENSIKFLLFISGTKWTCRTALSLKLLWLESELSEKDSQILWHLIRVDAWDAKTILLYYALSGRANVRLLRSRHTGRNSTMRRDFLVFES